MKRKRKRTLGSFGDLVGRTWEAVGTPKLGMGAEGRLKTALKPPPYLITDNSVMGMDSGTNGHVWHRGKSLDETELKWLQLPLPPFLSVSFFLQLCLRFRSLMDIFQISGQDGQRCLLNFSQFMLLPVSFPCACLGLTSKALQSNGGSPLSLLITISERGNNNREKGRVLKGVILKEAVTLKKRINQN